MNVAMVSVAEQFGNLRQTLGSVLGIYTLMRWFRSFFAKITGNPPPASASQLTPEKFAKFQGRLPDGSPAPLAPSRKPLIMFLVAVFGLPYLMGKLIRALAKGQEEAAARQMDQGGESLDLTNLEFCKVLYDFSPDQSAGVQGVDLAVKTGDLVAVLAKTDPLGNPSEWWKCRSRDGRMGYLPSPYLELIQRKAVGQIANGSPGFTPAGSRAQTMTTAAGGSRASTLTGMNVDELMKKNNMADVTAGMKPPVVAGGPETISVESFQKHMFNGS
jgi:peroxin-13